MGDLSTVPCGQVIGSHGVKGHLKIALYHKITIQEGTWCFLEIQEKPVPFFVEQILERAEDYFIVKLRGIDTPEESSSFRKTLFHLSEQAGKQGFEESAGDSDTGFLGYQIFDATQNEVGLVTDVYDNSGQILLQVKRGSVTHLVPFHSDWLIQLNDDEKKLVLNLPDGLIES